MSPTKAGLYYLWEGYALLGCPVSVPQVMQDACGGDDLRRAAHHTLVSDTMAGHWLLTRLMAIYSRAPYALHHRTTAPVHLTNPQCAHVFVAKICAPFYSISC